MSYEYRTVIIFFGLFVLLTFNSEAIAQLEWRVSVKFILDANGNRQTSGPLISNDDIQTEIDRGNQSLQDAGRGYQLVLTEIIDLNGVSQWFDADNNDRNALEGAAESDPETYEWRSNAINVYVSGGNGSGVCSFPGTGSDLILFGQGGVTGVILHEIGHFFGLCHTQGCPCGSCDAEDTGECHTTSGDDNIDDTIGDLQCWDQDDIATFNFATNYNNLSPTQQVQVDNVFFNVMSYHTGDAESATRLTNDQSDLTTDVSNNERSHVTDGVTHFVDAQSGHDVFGNGSSTAPYFTVQHSLSIAVQMAGKDILLLRAGTYSEGPLTINNPVTLRGSRGSVTLD